MSRQINALETGRYDLSLDLTLALANYFDCQIEDLIHPDRDDSDKT